MSRPNQPKLKPPPRPFFSCAIFRNCTQSSLSPKTPSSTAESLLQHPPPASSLPPLSLPVPSSSSSSSSSSASHSFTQWRFPTHQSHDPEPHRPPPPSTNLAEAYQASELHFSAGDSVKALSLLERSLATASASPSLASPEVMKAVAAALGQAETAGLAAKVLLAMVLAEGNRRLAVEGGAAAAAVEAVAKAGAGGRRVKERALAALELMCTVEEGAARVREQGMAVEVLVGCVEGMRGRGRECAMGILAGIYGGGREAEAPAMVVDAVVVALQGECSARGRRKGVQLLRGLKERSRLDLAVGLDD